MYREVRSLRRNLITLETTLIINGQGLVKMNKNWNREIQNFTVDYAKSKGCKVYYYTSVLGVVYFEITSFGLTYIDVMFTNHDKCITKF